MPDDSIVAPSRKALAEALTLAETLLNEIELSQSSLAIAMLKASRLARLLNDSQHQAIFEYEASGYPSEPDGLKLEIWEIAKAAGRVFKKKETSNDKEKIVERARLDSIEVLEDRISTNKIALAAAEDHSVSITSANPYQMVHAPSGNTLERSRIRNQISEDVRELAARRGFLHRYVAKKYDELRYSGIAEDIFSRIRTAVDDQIGISVPKAAQKFTAIYDNLLSENPEDWANAVHGCRRILQELADTVLLPREDKIVNVGGKDRTIKLGPDNYINRLMAFVEENSSSKRFNSIVGSNLAFLGDRLDSVFQAAQKGSHAEIATREEADRYAIYTYMIVADLLSLKV